MWLIKIPPSFFINMKKGVKICQRYENDCGAASLASVAAWYGLRLSLEEIKLKSNTSYEGTTIGGIIEAAGAFGMEAGGFRGNIGSLMKIDVPAILHMRKKSARLHFVVFYGMSGERFRIMDPSDGKFHKIKKEELEDKWSGYLVLIRRGPGFTQGDKRVKLGRRFFELFKNEWVSLTGVVLFAAIYPFVALAFAGIIRHITDEVIPGAQKGVLAGIATAALFITALSFTTTYLKSRLAIGLGLRVDKQLITGFISHVLLMPQRFFDLRRSGEISSRIYESFRIRALVTETGVSVLISLLSLIAAFVFMASLNIKLALISLLFIPVFIAVYLSFDKINRENIWQMSEEGSAFESFINETVRSNRSIKLFGIEDVYATKAASSIVSLNEKIKKSGLNFILGSSFNDALTKLLSFFVLIGGAAFVIGGELTTGQLIAFFSLLALFSSPLSQVAAAAKEIRSGIVAASRMFEICGLQNEREITYDMEYSGVFNEIAFCNVCFSYPGRASLLKNLNFTIKKGEIVWLKGANGAGKSTIASLLLRLYIPDSGKIAVDGINIEQFSYSSWRKYVGVVTQNPEIFTGSLLDNLVPGEKNIDFERLGTIMEILKVTKMLNNLPMGLQTILNRNATLLSRGEQQRISVARVIYREPSLIIFDEATASLDSESESAIYECIKYLHGRGISILMISHRSAEQMFAQRIIEL